jgi:hypothetical protein
MAVPGLVIGLLLAAVAAPADAPSEQALLDQAEAAFREGCQARGPAAREGFRRATAGYEELYQRGVRSPALCRNEGNAALLAGDLPHAVLASHRGLRLAPTDAELQANLDYAREQVVQGLDESHGRPPVEQWPPWLPRLASRCMLGLALVPYALGWLAVARWLMTRRGWLLAAGGVAFAAAALLAGGGVAFDALADGDQARHPLVVIAREGGVKLRKGNGQSYPEYEYVLRPGVEARLRFDDQRGWLQVELAGGEVGWVRRADVLVDSP